MKIPLYQVDAFTNKVFSGNPAAVCPLNEWLPDDVLQNIAAENNLSETAFFVKQGDVYGLRWFTPTVEVDLCGHATLASAFVLYQCLSYAEPEIRFDSQSGRLTVKRRDDSLVMDFPSWTPQRCDAPADLIVGLGAAPSEVLAARDYFAVYETEEEVLSLSPDMEKLAGLDRLGVIATAKGKDSDFVSRFFAPRAGIPEDPVTGSAHCMLIPYWASRLSKTNLHARQLSSRGGELFCTHLGERVEIAGNAVLYLQGEINV